VSSCLLQKPIGQTILLFLCFGPSAMVVYLSIASILMIRKEGAKKKKGRKEKRRRDERGIESY
jgi:hypothetical protein